MYVFVCLFTCLSTHLSICLFPCVRKMCPCAWWSVWEICRVECLSFPSILSLRRLLWSRPVDFFSVFFLLCLLFRKSVPDDMVKVYSQFNAMMKRRRISGEEREGEKKEEKTDKEEDVAAARLGQIPPPPSSLFPPSPPSIFGN